MKKSLRIVLSMLLVASAVVTASALSDEITVFKDGSNLADAKWKALAPSESAISADDGKSDFKMATFWEAAQRDRRRRIPTATLGPVRIVSPVDAAEPAINVPNMLGTVVYSDTWSENPYHAAGLYNVPTSAGQSFEENFSTSYGEGAYGALIQDDIYYAHWAGETRYGKVYAIYAYDVNIGYDSRCQKNTTIAGMAPAGVALDPLTKKAYGIFYTDWGDAMRLCSIEYGGLNSSAPVITEIAPLAGNWVAFAIDNAGQFYGIKGNQDGSYLCKLNRENGAVAVIGETGMYPSKLSGMTFDTKTNRLFWTVNPEDGTGFLTEINVNTGAATKIYDFPGNEEVVGLYIPFVPEGGAPAAITDLVLDYPEGTLSGTISFKAPTTTFNGEAGSGEFNYTVLFNETHAAEGTATYGEAISIPYTVAAPGEYKVVVSVYNAEGNGPEVKATQFIGNGIPKSPTVKLVYADGNMKLSWTAVNQAVDAGYIDPADITYDVVRYPGEVALGTFSHDVTTFSDPIEKTEEMIFYYYTVVVNNGNAKTAPVKSNVVPLGDVVYPPFYEAFDSKDALDVFKILDVNNDGKTWRWYSLYNSSLGKSDGAVGVQYNRNEAMNDWLVLPALKLKANMLYKVTFSARSTSMSNLETIEVGMGTEAAPEAMTKKLIKPTVLDHNEFKTYTANIVPNADGIYYVGIHGISERNMSTLYVDNIAVSEALSADVPGPVTDISIVPGTNGALYGDIKFKTPANLVSGRPITKIDKYEVYDESEQLLFSAGPIPGGAWVECPVPVSTDGTYTFSVVSHIGEYVSDPVSVTEYIGIDYPAVPEYVVLNEIGNTGEVVISWAPVTKDVRGSDLPEVSYTLATLSEGKYPDVWLGTKIEDTSFTARLVPEGKQELVNVGVWAESRRGRNAGTPSGMKFIGAPYVNYLESFADGKISHNMLFRGVNGKPQVYLFKNDMLEGIAAQDGDTGFVGIVGDRVGDIADLSLGKMSLVDAEKPGMTFFTYSIPLVDQSGKPVNNTNFIEVYVEDAHQANSRTLVYASSVYETGARGRWNKIYVDLAEYAGKDVVVDIEVTVDAAQFTFFDNIYIGDVIENDLAISIDAPAIVAPETEFNVAVTVANEGVAAAGAYSVKLKANGVVIASTPADALAYNDDAVYNYPYRFTAVDEEPVEFIAELVYADEVADNNTTSAVKVSPKLNNYPVPRNLSAEVIEKADIKLVWDEPAASDNPYMTKIEDFEGGEPFAKEFENWTFVDGDGAPIGGIQGVNMPGLVSGVTRASFFVLDGEFFAGSTASESYAGHSGSKSLAALFRSDGGTSDEWAISPMLSGNAQSISFYAKSYQESYPEQLEVYYSTGSLDPKDFIKVNDVVTPPQEWTLYNANLPEGALYFAIHSCATDAFMLMLDDFTFETNNENASLSLVGYNVYRNSLKVTDEPDAECEYIDAPGVAQDLKYVVTAVYTNGESRASNPVSISASGIDQVLSGINVSTEAGQIVVIGAEGKQISVMSVDGKVVFVQTGEAKTIVDVAPGVYIVKAGVVIVKVLVK